MTAARDSVLGAIRKATGMGDGSSDAVTARLDARAANIRPARANDDAEVIDRFETEATRAGTDVRRAASLDEVPGIVAAYLREHNLGNDIRVSGDPLAQSAPWDKEAMISVSSGPAEPTDTASCSVALAGVAETGTLMMRSGSENPAMLNYLPLAHIALLAESRIVGGYETAWQRVRDAGGTESFMTRMINLITGPSRTADIEQELLMGAHGPQKHMVIILTGE